MSDEKLAHLKEAAEVTAGIIWRKYGIETRVVYSDDKARIMDTDHYTIATVEFAREAYYVNGNATEYFYSVFHGEVRNINDTFRFLDNIPFNNKDDAIAALSPIIDFQSFRLERDGDAAVIKDPDGDVMARITKKTLIIVTKQGNSPQMVAALTESRTSEDSGLVDLRGLEISLEKYKRAVTEKGSKDAVAVPPRETPKIAAGNRR